MRKSDIFLGLLAGEILLLGLVFVHAAYRKEAERPFLAEKREIVRNLTLTDLCLFTEASYTRHLSQADIHTPFQDHPFSLEHFPSGSILMPPAIIKRINVKLD
jgi:hypothetical protein